MNQEQRLERQLSRDLRNAEARDRESLVRMVAKAISEKKRGPVPLGNNLLKSEIDAAAEAAVEALWPLLK